MKANLCRFLKAQENSAEVLVLNLCGGQLEALRKFPSSAREQPSSRHTSETRKGGGALITQTEEASAAEQVPGSGRRRTQAPARPASSTSECPSLVSTAAEESPGGDAVGEQGQQEDLEEKFVEGVCGLPHRQACRDSAECSGEPAPGPWRPTSSPLLLERRLTLAHALEKCLKKGKGEEQALAAAILGLLCVQLGPGPKGEELSHSLQPPLVSVLRDSTAGPAAWLHCASALGVGCYDGAAAGVQDLVSCLTCLEGVFSRFCGALRGQLGPAQDLGIYTAFKDVPGSGLHHHLQNDELLRDIFGLGPVLVLDATALKACKIPPFKKHRYNAPALKAQTEARSCVQDKRADIL
ncbi:interferon-related developmental regulator 2 [Camelus ferus]|nr:interferon-related developmental regulator 2 [Camelus ferus]